MITNNSLSEIGDVLLIYSQTVVNGNINLTSFTDQVTGVTGTRFFEKKFRYSLDGVIYSDWIELTDLNLQQVNGVSLGLSFFEFRYKRVGSDSTGILEFVNLELEGNIDIQICVNTITMVSIFNDLYDNDFYTVAIRNNILRKIFHHGILPRFIERGDGVDNEDFIAFWSAVCLFISYFSAFAKGFDDIVFRSDYLSEYLRQYNIQISEKEITYQHLFFLSSNFYDEVRKRGTQMTYKKSGTELIDGSFTQIDGEWLRLLCRNHYDEFLLEVIEKKKGGFCLDESSPLYNGTYFSKQLNKTEENTDGIEDLSKYTVINGPLDQTYFLSKLCVSLNRDKGLGYILESPPVGALLEDLIIVDDELDYEITFEYSRGGGNIADATLNVGVTGFNRNGVLIPDAFLAVDGTGLTNTILSERIEDIAKVAQIFYSFRGIIYANKTIPIADGRTNLNKGKNLKFFSTTNHEVEKLKISVYVSDYGVSDSQLFLHNLKMRPLIRGKNILPTSDSAPYVKNPQFLQSTTFCLNWRKNNGQDKTDNQVDNFIQNYLLPYQQKIISIPITPEVGDKQVLI